MITKEGYKRLLHFLIWCIVGCIIAIIGISNVFADEVINSSNFFSVTGRRWSSSSPEYTEASPVLFNNWAKHAWNVSSGIYTPPNSFDYITLSYFQHNGNYNPCSGGNYRVSFSLKFTTLNYVNYVRLVQFADNNCSIVSDSSTGIITANCPISYSSSSGGVWASVWYNEISGNSSSDLYISKDISVSCSLNTDAITDNATQNTQNIINNNNNNTQNIINNNDENTQKIIDSNKVCNVVDKNSISLDGKYLSSTGIEYNYSDYGITKYYNINRNTIITPLELISNTANFCYYTENKSVISCSANSSLTSSDLIIPNNAKYIRFTISKSNNKPQFEICNNGSQATNDSINNLNDTLKDDNVDDNNIASSFEDFNDFLDDNSTITQLITLPITLYTAILNNLNGACSPFNLGALYGENLILPCINVSQYLGSSLWNMIDIIISGFAIFAISKKMIKVFNNFSSLREGDVIDD